MAKIKFLPLVVLLSLLASCGGGASESVESESESEPPVSESESEQDTTQFGLSLALKDGEPLKIAQFADIHFGIEGNDWHNDKVDRTKTYMDYVVETAKPDLIVCSGDNILSTGVTKLKNFINIMEDYETPWTFIYGNHDSESNQTGYSKAELNEDKTGYVVKFAQEGANSTATKAVIVAISYNDYNQIAVDTRTVNFKDTNETDAPELQDNIVWNSSNFLIRAFRCV